MLERRPPVDLTHIDGAAFAREVDALHADLMSKLGEEDIIHLRKMMRWSTYCTVTGYLTATICPNPISAFLLSIGNLSSWISMHHVGHRGYDRVPNAPRNLTSKGFATGARRYIDWLDWMLPEAWKHEHNHVHHPKVGEEGDPDMVERNAEFIRDPRLPMVFKWLVIGAAACSWKFAYYAPNTIRELHRAKRRRAGNPDAMSGEDVSRLLFDFRNPEGRRIWYHVFDPRTAEGRQLWTQCFAPYALLRFVAIPAAFSIFGPWAAFSVLINSLVAEILANIHAFLVIVPNHTGDDLLRFEGPSRDKAEFYIRQVSGSVNYMGGTDIEDFFQGYLNYQIEHHVWPDMPMRKYQQAQPRLQEICERHGVPYVREKLSRRLVKLTEILTGKSSMRYGITATAKQATSAPRRAPVDSGEPASASL